MPRTTENGSPQPSREAVNITVRANAAGMPGSLAEIARPVLTARHRAFSQGGTLGYQQSTSHEEFFEVDPDNGDLVFPAGLVPRVVRHLEQHGLRVQVNHDDQRELLQTYLAAAQDVECAPELRDALTTNTQGQILVPRAKDAIDVMEAICRIWRPRQGEIPPSNTQIVVRDKQRQRVVHRELSGRLDFPVLLPPEVKAGCVSVITPTYYGGGRLWSVAIFDGPQPLLAGQNINAACLLSGQVKFCVRPEHETLDESSEIRVAALCGPVIYPPERQPAAHVTVAFAQVPHIHAPRKNKLNALERKRCTIWHNDGRNDVIAAIARACVDGNAAALYEHGLFLDMDDQAVHQLLYGRDVTVLVESPEHGRKLLQRLPGWELAASIPDSRGVVEVPAGFHRCIVTETMAYAQAFESVEPLQEATLTAAREYGFWEGITPESANARWRASRRRWLRFRREAYARYGLLDDVR
jgi:hypothetical protein